METARRLSIPVETRQQIKHDQECVCVLCQKKWREKYLYIHHIIPVSHHVRGEEEMAARRENLCALCDGCHKEADHYALEKRVYLPQLIEMRAQSEYEV